MPSSVSSIDANLAQSLGSKSEEELVGILVTPEDWRPEVVDFARAELERRSILGVEIERKLSEKAQQKGERAEVPLTRRESVGPFLLGFFLGTLGFLITWPIASRFERRGYVLKARRCWRMCWYGLGAGIATLIVLGLIAAAMR